MPAGAGVHTSLPVALYVPGLHGTGIGVHEVRPVSPPVEVPGAHGVGADAPATLTKKSTGAGTHETAPVTGP